jgi:uncharacterized protein (DUF58 family)
MRRGDDNGSAGLSLARWLEATPSGRPFKPLPWADAETARRQELPFYVRPGNRPFGPIGAAAALFAAVGLACGWPALAAIACGVVTLLLAAYQETWRASGAIELGETAAAPARVVERETFHVSVPIVNRGKRRLETLLVRGRFTGATDGERLVAVPSLAPGEQRRILLRFTADGGMGPAEFQGVDVVVRDAFGLFPRCFALACSSAIDVRPEEPAPVDLPVEVAGHTLQAGDVDVRRSGDSPTFLGLRPFRAGDSIRRVDWRRSMRHRELVVREFERLASTDATIVLDDRPVAQVAYRGVDSFETLRDAAVATVHALTRQRLRLRLVTSRLVTELGAGAAHADLLTEIIHDLKPAELRGFNETLAAAAPLVEPETLLVPIFVPTGVDLAHLLDTLLALDDRRVATMPIVIDAQEFESRIFRAARVTDPDRQTLWSVRASLESAGAYDPTEQFVRKLARQAVVLGPGDTLAGRLAEDVAWRPKHARA